uniref:UDENN domain-containing protein n=1 Tax=Percolomonas cosmopolitus TaxID=63605 RepID=A0A7S1KQW5_9EUKA
MILTPFNKGSPSSALSSSGSGTLSSSSICHCVCLSEFHIQKGTVLSHKYPPNVALPTQNTSRSLVDLAIPDGAHIFQSDTSYVFLQEAANSRLCYCVIHFQSKRDSSVKRGAVQKSLILFSYEPLFELFERVCRIALTEIMNASRSVPDVLQTVYEVLSQSALRKELSVKLWNHAPIPVKMPKSLSEPNHREDRFGALAEKGLVDLCLLFGRDIMLLWYAMLHQRRVLVVGAPAKRVGACVMALPLLVAPLRGFSAHMSPYVCLVDVAAPIMQQSSYYVGSTNHLMETKEAWWDCCASFAQGRVKFASGISSVKLTAHDRDHIQNVLGGIKDGKSEQWVCDQFEAYTLRLLQQVHVSSSTGKKIKNKNHLALKSSVLFQRWEQDYERALQEGSQPLSPNKSPPPQSDPPVQILKVLKHGMEDMAILDRVKKTFDLSKRLTNLSTIDEMCDHGAVETVSSWLSDSNSQIRKYSAQILSQLVLSVKGQNHLLQDEFALKQILGLMDDSMPNVRVASYYCLMKLSSIGKGRNLILQMQILQKLIDSISDKINDVKIYSARSLRNLYKDYDQSTISQDENLNDTNVDIEDDDETTNSSNNQECITASTSLPDTPASLSAPSQETISAFICALDQSADKILKSHLLLLLDQWEADLHGKIAITPKHEKLFDAFLNSSENAEKLEASRALLSQIASESHESASTLILEMAECEGLIDKLLENENHKNDQELRNLSSLVLLRLVSVSKYASQCAARKDTTLKFVRMWVNFIIKHQKDNDLTRNTLLTLKVLFARDERVVRSFCKAKGVHALANLIERHYANECMSDLTLLCISTLNAGVRCVVREQDMNTFAQIKEPLDHLKTLRIVSSNEKQWEEESVLVDIEQRLTSCLAEVLQLE